MSVSQRGVAVGDISTAANTSRIVVGIWRTLDRGVFPSWRGTGRQTLTCIFLEAIRAALFGHVRHGVYRAQARPTAWRVMTRSVVEAIRLAQAIGL